MAVSSVRASHPPVGIPRSEVDKFNPQDGFARRFRVLPASTPALRDEVFRLRHRVYCEDLGYETPRADGREMDEFDDKAIHLLLHYLPTDEFMGCARLVRPLTNHSDGLLPFEHICRDVLYPEFMGAFASCRNSIAEVSRLAVESKFRRRRGEKRRPAPLSAHDFGDDLRPRFPYLVLGLYLGIVAAAQATGIRSLFLLSEPRLATHFSRLGVAITRIGGEVEHRGTRVPSHMDVDSVVEGLSPFLRPLYDEVAQEVGFALEGER